MIEAAHFNMCLAARLTRSSESPTVTGTAPSKWALWCALSNVPVEPDTTKREDGGLSSCEVFSFLLVCVTQQEEKT